jgi:hypothetical protein
MADGKWQMAKLIEVTSNQVEDENEDDLLS